MAVKTMCCVGVVKSVFAGVLLLTGVALNSVVADVKPLTIAMLIPGNINDGGFMEAGFNGLMAVKEQLGARTSYMADVESDVDTLAGALRRLADSGPDLIIAHGGQTAYAARRVAAEYSQVRFVVTQGDVIAQNLSSYEVLQEESAWLAGAVARSLTETELLGNISGIRITPGTNVGDWVAVDPERLVGPAVADVSAAVLAAARDVANGDWAGNQLVQISLDGE